MVLLTVHSAVDLGGWQHIVCVFVITLSERFEYFLKKNYATCLHNCKDCQNLTVLFLSAISLFYLSGFFCTAFIIFPLVLNFFVC